MEQLKKEVSSIIYSELLRAMEAYGRTYNSEHESYSILREELDEATDECSASKVFVDRYWKSVKENDVTGQRENLVAVYEKSMYAACEFIQTSAVALKALKTLDVLNNGGVK